MTSLGRPTGATTDSSAHRLSGALSELAGLLLDTDSFQAVMQQLAETAPRLVPGLLTAGITVAVGNRVITVASMDAMAQLLDERQYELDEGPCLESMRSSTVIDVPDVSSETRWGPYPAQVRALGVESTHSIPLTAGTGRSGCSTSTPTTPTPSTRRR